MSVNNVSAVSDAIKYLNGMDIEDKEASIAEDLKSSIFSPITLAFGGMETVSFLKSKYGAKKLFGEEGLIKDIIKGKLPPGASEGTLKLGDAFTQTFKEVEDKARAAKNASEAAGNGIFKKIGNYIAKGKKGISNLAHKGIAALGKTPVGSAIKSGLTKFGKTAIGGAIKTGASKIGTALKGTGAVGMIAIEGVLGLVTEVVPAFQMGGAESGFKQLGKTAVKAAGSGLGWAGGSVAGGTIGAAIGSIFGPLGTAIGGALGKFIGGIAGSVVGGGVAKKITGKSEVEKLQEKEINAQAAQIAQDPEAMNELNQMVQAQIQAEAQSGTANENTEKMAQYYMMGAFGTNNTAQNSNANVFQNISNTNYSTALDAKTAAKNTASYYADVASRVAQGDTSVYNISDDKLNSVFTTKKTSNGAYQDSSDLYTGNNYNKDKQIQYFG